MDELSCSFRAMNTVVETVVIAPEEAHAAAWAALAAVEALFARVESALSRFRPDSELSALNRSAGHTFQCSPLLSAVVAAALTAARETGGVFDPTILHPLLEAGYDRSFELLCERQEFSRRPSSTPHTWRDISFDRRTRQIRLPAGCGLDLGGIAKGWTVDRAATLLSAFPACAVDAGGDIRIIGCQADGSPWTIAVEDPYAPQHDLLSLTVRDRAVATSSTMRRRWRNAGGQRHHLIDPRTARPSNGPVLQATALAGSVARAEVLAKTALLLGPLDGLRLLEGQADADGILVGADGRLTMTHGLREMQHVA